MNGQKRLKQKSTKKLAIQRKIEKLKYPDGDFWKSKMPKIKSK